MKKKLIAGIDVGTTKIVSVIAEAQGSNIRVLGCGNHPSRGLKKGIIVNLSETINSLRRSLKMAEQASETEVQSSYVSIGGCYLRGVNSRGETEVRGRNGEISGDDIDRAVGAATSLDIPQDYEVIHVLTQHFRVDGQEGVIDPLGMFGRQLSVQLHMVLNASAIVQNIVNAVNKADLMVEGVVMQQLASAEAILSADEKELGALVVDIGGGTTDIALYSQGSIWHSEVLPMGGAMGTKDLAIGLKAPIQEAEELKKELGSVFPESVPTEEVVELTEVGTGRRRTVSRRQMCQIIQARCDEILGAISKVVKRAGLSSELITGVVLTGGGALLDGLPDRAEQILGMPVRLGYPINIVGHDSNLFDPSYSTALGLLKYSNEIKDKATQKRSRQLLPRSGTRERMKIWFLEKIS